ncbi:hypothetical protein EYC84_011554 [Monilinia fructicola]|uniref:Uncharacterized protein n=1 Tax=Monilinia fructicola TaxID=38448 RepID=A0A5M9J5H9_MONFR|nr:hypothetical protein EYC84_011554 [Monilinia fructicola]
MGILSKIDVLLPQVVPNLISDLTLNDVHLKDILTKYPKLYLLRAVVLVARITSKGLLKQPNKPILSSFSFVKDHFARFETHYHTSHRKSPKKGRAALAISKLYRS